MVTKINLARENFPQSETVLLESDKFEVRGWTYPTGIESVKLSSDRVAVEVLPFMGQILWNVEVDGKSLRMENMFTYPQPATEITDTYGCFAFHSGLLSAGCPGPEDTHPLRGEFSCAPFGEAWIEVSEDSIAISGRYEYTKGFGDHYEAKPVVRLHAGESFFDIDMEVTNLSKYQPMPLQYMCHMNYLYEDGAKFGGSLPDSAFTVRSSIPDHVHPTDEWREMLDGLITNPKVEELSEATHYDPEIVWFADNLPQYGEEVSVTMGDYFIEFPSKDFNVGTRWILHNADQKVCAFLIPGTSRPEGAAAARKAGTMIELKAGETRNFHVRTGKRS